MDLRALRYFLAVVEERHFGRAAVRLHMTQPPLSRAVRQLETELGAVLLHRSPSGVGPTAAGTMLYEEARALLEQSELLRVRVAAAAGAATITVGVLWDSAEQAGTGLADAFRSRHPGVVVRVRESDLTDPTAGLLAGLADVALTRAPISAGSISTALLREDPAGVLMRADDPLAGRAALTVNDLTGRRWYHLPDGSEEVWSTYWKADGRIRPDSQSPVIRTVHECLQAVLWNGAIGLAPMTGGRRDGLVVVPLEDMRSSQLVVAWHKGSRNPLVRSFVRLASEAYRGRDRTARPQVTTPSGPSLPPEQP